MKDLGVPVAKNYVTPNWSEWRFAGEAARVSNNIFHNIIYYNTVLVPMSAARHGQSLVQIIAQKNINGLIAAKDMGGFWISNNGI